MKQEVIQQVCLVVGEKLIQFAVSEPRVWV